VLPGKKYTPDEILRILARRWWLIPPPVMLGLLCGVFLYSRVPEMYRSETLIMVVPQRIPDAYVKSVVTTNVEDRLPSIREQILSRSRLERIIVDFNLYPEKRARGAMEDVVEQMRKNVDIALEGKESFRVTFVSGDARTAQKVTERLASLTIEEHLRDRESFAENTNQFLESQLQDAKRRLVEHESKLETYRRRYAGQLPSQLQANLQAIQNAQAQLQSVTTSTNAARERRLEIERQISDAQSLPLVAVPAGGAAPAPATLTAAQQLEAAQANLELFKQRYTPDHPDIRALERSIKELQVRVAEEAKRSPDAATSKPLTAAEAFQRQRIRDLQGQLEIVDRQIAANTVEEARLRDTLASYQAKVDVLPTRESELVELTRDYSTLQESYATLLKKREDSQLSANLERRQVGEQFRVLDPASMPEGPFNEGERRGALMGSVVGGLALGLSLIALLEYRDSSFKKEEEVLRLLNLPVLALVPQMWTESDRLQMRRRKRLVAVGMIAVVVVVGSAAAFVWQLRA
jgi:polysaccharide chain length determinant protein (PEP-CTERM system associated)